MNDQIEKFHARLRETNFRIQSEFLISRMDYVTVLDWFKEDDHKYIALVMDEKEYKNTPDLGAYWADRVMEILSTPSPKTRFGRYMVSIMRKYL